MRLALCVLTAAILVACGKKVENPPAANTTQVSEPVVALPTPEEALDAMLRGHPNSRRICIDGLRERSYFLDYGPLPEPGAKADGYYHGWLFIEKVDFYPTSNKTWFITNQAENKYKPFLPKP